MGEKVCGNVCNVVENMKNVIIPIKKKGRTVIEEEERIISANQ